MFFRETLPFIKDFVDELAQALEEHSPETPLTRSQKKFLGFCLMGILVTNSVCWARFERASLGKRSAGAICWMFCRAPIPWEWIFHMVVRVILRKYGLDEGVLLVDDTDHQRAKTTTRIHLAHKIFDKKTSGFFNGQTIVFLVLVADSITIPVGFTFYCSFPSLSPSLNSATTFKMEAVDDIDRKGRFTGFLASMVSQSINPINRQHTDGANENWRKIDVDVGFSRK